MRFQVTLQTVLVVVFHSALSADVQNDAGNTNQIYLDVKPANTTIHLESVRMLPLSTFRFAYERSDAKRERVGVLGHDLAAIIPDAVEIIPKRTLPPRERGSKPIVLENIPSVNEQTLFMYSLGATQELSRLLRDLESHAEIQMKNITTIYGDVTQLEQIITATSDSNAELRMREAAAKADIARNEMELEVMLAKNEREHTKALQESEIEQLRRSEWLTLRRLEREDAAEKTKMERVMRAKFEASQRIENTRAEAAEAVGAVEHQQKLLLQRASEEVKVRTARSVAIAKADAERANEDVHIRKLQAESEQRTKRVLAAIDSVVTLSSRSLSTAAKNPKEVITFIGYISLLTSSIFLAKEMARLIRSIIEAMIGKPQLIRETTRNTLPWSLLAYIGRWIPWDKRTVSGSIEDEFRDIILPKALKERVIDLAYSARNARRRNAPFRHVLLYGPPGTGKTLLAQKLAKVIGLDYALMSGGDVSPLGADAVTQIHNLFAWARYSPKGVILFVDEAEVFLGSRDSTHMTEVSHNALNAVLYNTGGERKDFMLVLATNRPQDLDEAILDRCDESLYFPLPDAQCRKELILLYFDLHFRKFMENKNKEELALKSRLRRFFSNEQPLIMSIEHNLMTGEQLEATTAICAGFSGREIGKLMVALQGAMYVSSNGRLDFHTAWKLIKSKVVQHKDKKTFGLQNISRGKSTFSCCDGESLDDTVSLECI